MSATQQTGVLQQPDSALCGCGADSTNGQHHW
jgi:hypothetical protein